MLRRNFRKTGPLLAAILAAGFLGSAAHAATVVSTFAGSGPDTNPSSGGPGGTYGTVTVSGQVVFSYDSVNQQLDIALSNTTTQPNMTSRDTVLDSLTFNLSGNGLSLSTGGTAGATGELATYSTSPSPDGTFTPSGTTVSENSYWGAGALTGEAGVTGIYPQDNYVVSDDDVDLTPTLKSFNGSTINGNAGTYGVIPTYTTPPDHDNFIGTPTYTWGTINIVLNLNGTTSLTSAQVLADLQNDISSVNFFYGVSEPPTIVAASEVVAPLPSSVASGLLLLSGLAGLGLLRKRVMA